MGEARKARPQAPISDLPKGLQELIAAPEEPQKGAILLPASFPQHPVRPKTQKEQELDALIAKRKSIIDSLKARNLLALQARKKIAALIPLVQGKGAPQAIRLMEEAEKTEFSIATEAYTPKKEKELIKRLRQIRHELSKHRELEAAHHAIGSARKELHSITCEIKSLERQLAEARKACEDKYSEILAERRAEYEARLKRKAERAKLSEEEKRRRIKELQRRVQQEKKRQREAEMAKYMKKHDDTVSLEEIADIERKKRVM